MEQSGILIVDDNPEIREVLHILLSGEGYRTGEAKDGHEALGKLQEAEYDLIILDVMMPDMNGYRTCMEIRRRTNAPILFLSARTQDGDKTLGFASGGDDYLAKPFSYSELLGRVKALLRRYQVYRGKKVQEKSTVYRRYNIEIREDDNEVYVDGEPVELTDTEYGMLVLMMKNEKQIFSAQHLYEAVWKEPYYYGANNTVMVHIRNLRKKIEEDPQNPKRIRTIWGKGYRFD